MTVHSKYSDPVFLSSLDNLHLAAKCTVDGFFAGCHQSPHKGFSLEYSEHRDYYPGDDPKYIDWKAYARSDRLYVKQSTSQTNTNLYLLLDTSDSMGYSSKKITKLEYAALLCSAIAYLAVNQNDGVSLVVFADRILRNISVSRKSQLNLIYNELENASSQGKSDISTCLHTFAENTYRRGIVIVISDLQDDITEIKRAIYHLKSSKNDVIIFHILDTQEIHFNFYGLIDFEDMETGAHKRISTDWARRKYLKNFHRFVEEIQTFCGMNKIDHVIVDTADSVHNCLATYLKNRTS